MLSVYVRTYLDWLTSLYATIGISQVQIYGIFITLIGVTIYFLVAYLCYEPDWDFTKATLGSMFIALAIVSILLSTVALFFPDSWYSSYLFGPVLLAPATFIFQVVNLVSLGGYGLWMWVKERRTKKFTGAFITSHAWIFMLVGLLGAVLGFLIVPLLMVLAILAFNKSRNNRNRNWF